MTDDRQTQCPGCGYDLKGRALDSEFCPECGAFLPSQDMPKAKWRAPLVLRKTLQADDRGILVRNADLPPALVERHLNAAARHAEIWFAVGVIGLIVTFIGCIGLAMILNDRGLLPDLLLEHPLICLGLLGVGHFAVYRIIVKGCLIDRAIRRHVRTTLREEGYDLCRRCGWFFNEGSSEATACPYCHAERAPRMDRTL